MPFDTNYHYYEPEYTGIPYDYEMWNDLLNADTVTADDMPGPIGFQTAMAFIEKYYLQKLALERDLEKTYQETPEQDIREDIQNQITDLTAETDSCLQFLREFREKWSLSGTEYSTGGLKEDGQLTAVRFILDHMDAGIDPLDLTQ